MFKNNIKQTSLVIALTLVSFTAGYNLHPLIARAENSTLGVFLKAYDLLNFEYLEDLDNDKLVQGAIRGMLEATGDPYTRYMDPKSYQGMKEEREGSFSGVGIQIGMRKHKDNGHEIDLLTIIAPLEDTPAWKAGLLSGDVILEIDNKSTKGLSIDEAVNLIKGQRGTTVKLKIFREATKKVFEVPIVRDNIIPKVVKSKMLENGIAYVRLTTFMSAEAPNELKNTFNKLKKEKMNGLIFDLRGNPGGLLPNAVKVASMFIPKGPIVQIVNKKMDKEVLESTGKVEIPDNIPVILLIDGGSASASEIVAGALKDAGRATLLGTKTFGKGLVQTVHELEDGSGMTITTNKYLTRNGNDINKKGIEPNIIVDLPKDKIIENDFKIGDKNDTQLMRAIEEMNKKLEKNTKNKVS
jgi:carboxyl-terminal processing protease